MKGNKYQPEIDTITLQLLAHQFCEFTFTQEYNPGSQSYPTHMSTVLGSIGEGGSILASKEMSNG